MGHETNIKMESTFYTKETTSAKDKHKTESVDGTAGAY